MRAENKIVLKEKIHEKIVKFQKDHGKAISSSCRKGISGS